MRNISVSHCAIIVATLYVQALFSFIHAFYVINTPEIMYYTRIRMSVWIITVLTCLLGFFPMIRAMICYRCTVLPPQYIGEADQPCSKFDSSSRFYHDCPMSTFCMKRIIHYKLPNGTMIATAERNCASQKYISQNYNNNEKTWHSKEAVDTKAYTEGCFKGENRGTPNGPSEYCYCSSNYCNKSSTMIILVQTCHYLVIALFLFLRFL